MLQTSIQDQLAYILTLLSHILQQDNTRGEAFLKLEQKNLIQTFSRIWARDDISGYTAGKAAICAAIILSQAYAFEMKFENNNNNDNDWKQNEMKNNDSNENDINVINNRLNIRHSKYEGDYRLLCEWMLREFTKKNDKLLPSLYALKVELLFILFVCFFVLARVCWKVTYILNNVWHANLRIFCCFEIYFLECDSVCCVAFYILFALTKIET